MTFWARSSVTPWYSLRSSRETTDSLTPSRLASSRWALAKDLGVDAAAMWAIETTHIPVYLPADDDLEKNKEKFDLRRRTFWPLKEVARVRPNLPVGQELWTAQATGVNLARHIKEEPGPILTRLSADVQQAYAKDQT